MQLGSPYGSIPGFSGKSNQLPSFETLKNLKIVVSIICIMHITLWDSELIARTDAIEKLLRGNSVAIDAVKTAGRGGY